MYDRVLIVDREGVDMRRITARIATVLATGLVAGVALAGVAAAEGPSGETGSGLMMGGGSLTNVGGPHGITTGQGGFLGTGAAMG
jgi:hypothetical protein